MKFLHERIARQLQDCLNNRRVPKWMVLGRTVLVIKDQGKGNRTEISRPMTCLSLMWKLSTGIVSELNEHLKN